MQPLRARYLHIKRVVYKGFRSSISSLHTLKSLKIGMKPLVWLHIDSREIVNSDQINALQSSHYALDVVYCIILCTDGRIIEEGS